MKDAVPHAIGIEYDAGYAEDPGILLTRKEAYHNLSPEAKDTLRMVINKPEKLLRLNKKERMRKYIHNFLYKEKQHFGYSYSNAYRRKLSVRKDFETIREFLSLFSGVSIWR